MSKFNKYGKKVDVLARSAFEEFLEAEAKFKAADASRKKHPQGGYSTAEAAAKSARVHADFLKAKADLEAARKALSAHSEEIGQLRRTLEEEVESYYAADPSAVDANTIALLQSGILSASEYNRLLENAKGSGNFTMGRLIAKSAGDAAEEVARKYGDNNPEARELRRVSYNNSDGGADTMARFDYLANVFSRTCNNPNMIGDWGDLTEHIIDEM